LHEASIAFGNTLDEFDLSASLYIRFVEDLDIVFDGSVSWDRVDSTSVSFGWGISLNANVDVPIPFFVTRGRIEGRAFIDRDGDGLYGLYDRPLDGIVIEADGGEASTNADGRFRFAPFYPKTYTLTVSRLPADAKAGDPIDVELPAGATVWVDVPLTPVVVVSGRLFDDENQDGIAGADEGGFAQVRVLLRDEADVVADARTDLTGGFSFTDVLPGRYTVAFDAETLPDRFAFTTAEEAEIDVEAEAPPTILFGGFIRPRDVIVTFQPPTADFAFSPAAPAAGGPITFDGTASFDFDGEIVAHAWDFDGDGEPDASGSVAEHAFAEPGVYAVSLTVTDDAGNIDTVTLSIEIGGDADDEPGSGLPIAGFRRSPTEPIAGEPILFNGTTSIDPDGQIVSFAWDFDGDGAVDSTAPIAEHTYDEAGTYTVSLTVTDDGGNASTTAETFTVAAPPEAPHEPVSIQPPIADFAYMPAAPSPGDPVLFNGTFSSDFDGEIVGYAWDFDGDGTIDSTDPVAEHRFAAPGTYPVSLTVTDDGGNADTITISIDVE